MASSWSLLIDSEAGAAVRASVGTGPDGTCSDGDACVDGNHLGEDIEDGLGEVSKGESSNAKVRHTLGTVLS